MSKLLFYSRKRSAEKRRVMMDVHVVYTALMVFGCIVFRPVVCKKEYSTDMYYSCKDGFYHWKNKCYKFVLDRTRTWDEALRVCTDNYLRLAEPATSSYYEHLKATARRLVKIARGNRLFIGLRQRTINGITHWRWNSNDEPVSFADWAPWFPDHFTGDCGYLWFEKEPITWRTMGCFGKAYVICEYNTELNECKSMPFVCAHGGTCIDTIYARPYCSCTASTWGTMCQHDLMDQCTSSPCRNAGTCYDVNFGYYCLCPPYWTGTNCETGVNACDNLCQHGGTCQQLNNEYICSCTSEWTGTRCEEENECASNPCEDRGVCSEHKSYFVCRCTTGFTGSSCQFELPGELYHNCPEVVYVDQRLLCDCKILDPGEPAATVGWRDWRKPESTAVIRTLEIPTVHKSDEGKTFTCQYTWNANGTFTKQVNYTLRMAPKKQSSKESPTTSAPGEPAVKIFAPNPFETDGLQPMTLLCDTTLDVQVNRVQWSGVNCQGGNYATSCTFTPDPTLDTGKKVKCTIHDPNIALDTTEAEYTLNFTWTGIARVKRLQVEGRDSDLVTDKTNEPYKLDCLAIGDPKPYVDVFLVTDATDSGSAAREVKQVKYVDVSEGLYRRQKVYTVMSPAVCQTNHTFRCYTKNSNGSHSKTITITADCVPSIQSAGVDMSLVGSLGIAFGVMIALLATSVLFVRRWRKKSDMRQMAEADARRGPTVESYDAGLTEPQTSDTPAGETTFSMFPDTSADGISQADSTTDASIDSAVAS